MEVIVETDPKRIAEMRAGMAVYRRNSEALLARYDELFAAHPEEWVTVRDDRIFHAATIELIYAELELECTKIDGGPTEFMGRDRAPFIF